MIMKNKNSADGRDTSAIVGLISGEKFSAAAMTVLVIAVAMVLNIILYTVVELFGLYLYEPLEDDLSISGNTDELFEEALEKAKVDGNKVNIIFFRSEEDVKYHDTGYFVYTTAKNFEARYPELIELEFINITTRRNDKGELVEDLDKYKTTDDGKTENAISRATVVFEYGETWRVVTDTYTSAGYADFFTLASDGSATAYNGEEVMAGMIKWVLEGTHKKAYFTQGHGEVADFAFSNLLGSAGYYVDTRDLRKEDIPEDAELVVISNPTFDFESAAEGSGARGEMQRLREYLEGGGQLIVTLDPKVKKLPNLEGLLAEYGIAFSVTVTDGKEVRNMVKDTRNAITTDGFTLVLDYARNETANKIFSRIQKYGEGDNVLISQVAALELSEGVIPLLVSSPQSVTEASGGVTSRDGSYPVAALSEKTYESGKTGRIFMMSSMYLAASDALVSDGYSNRDFLYSLLGDCFGQGDMPYGANVVLTVTTTLRNLKLGTAGIYTAVIMSLPVVAALVGTVVIVRRKYR